MSPSFVVPLISICEHYITSKGYLQKLWLRVAIPDVHLYFCQMINATVPLLKIVTEEIDVNILCLYHYLSQCVNKYIYIPVIAASRCSECCGKIHNSEKFDSILCIIHNMHHGLTIWFCVCLCSFCRQLENELYIR